LQSRAFYSPGFPGPAFAGGNDDPRSLHRGRAKQFSIGGTAFRVLSSCLVSGSHPSLEHGAVGNMKACLDSSCSLHRDFGCRLRGVKWSFRRYTQHTNELVSLSLSFSEFMQRQCLFSGLFHGYHNVTETLTRTATCARGSALDHIFLAECPYHPVRSHT
jgi:hypothetical protein